MNTDAGSQFDTVAVLGAGVIGASWTALYLAAGLRVKVFDITENFEAKVDAYVKNAWPTLQQLGLTDSGDCHRASFHKSASAAVQGADFIQENVPECIETKLALYREIEPELAPNSIVASSASGLMLKGVAVWLEKPESIYFGPSI